MQIFNQNIIDKNTKRYDSKARELKFLLGGIGTGNISIDARGRLCDFEIFNKPDKGLDIPYTFFAIWSRIGDGKPDARILEARLDGPGNLSHGYPSGSLSGLPRFERGEFSSNYPFANIQLTQDSLPLAVGIEAFTPFIPLNADDSGLPGFVIRYRVKNLSDQTATVSVCGSMSNVCGLESFDGYDRLLLKDKVNNTVVGDEGLNGLNFSTDSLSGNDISYGTLSLTTKEKEVTIKPVWQTGGWWDGAEEFWQDFREDGELNPDVSSDSIGSIIAATHDRMVGSVAVKRMIEPGCESVFEFFVSWHFPNRYGWWPDGHCDCSCGCSTPVQRNYYATRWSDALDASRYLSANLEKLEIDSRNFANALFSTTVDKDVVESLAATITVMRSPSCFRIEDGSFYSWEGCFKSAGCCPGSCTHVLNYAQSIAFLFPELERSMRRIEFLTETDEDGNMAFRAKRVLDGEKWDMLPATDGQLGSVLRVYREWKMSGDDGFLEELWDKVALALDFAFDYWDEDGDFVLESRQHNTYDIEFYGVSSLTNSIFFAALKAGAEMAAYLGEKEKSEKWTKAYKAGSKLMDEELWGGEYYVQKISEEDLKKYRYQYGRGCLSDQLLGQQLAHVYGLGYILPEDHVKSAMRSIYKYNFKTTLEEHHSVQRGYVLNDEAALVLCTWPHGGRPKQPFVYSDEAWTGIEYHVATHLIYEGMIDESMDIIHALRKRHDGYRRNPFNEIECGNHYVRSMASWGLLIALSGYRFDMVKGEISFDPKVSKEDFSCFFSNGKAWGVYKQKTGADGGKEFTVIPLYGSLEGVSIN